jgi:biopolymer transport protein ExbD
VSNPANGDLMSLALGTGGKPAAEMNVTPLIDVLLVLLIIFMIITPMDPHGLYTAIPQEHGKATSDETPIVLQLTQAKRRSVSLHQPAASRVGRVGKQASRNL